jgi:TonB family protein
MSLPILSSILAALATPPVSADTGQQQPQGATAISQPAQAPAPPLTITLTNQDSVSPAAAPAAARSAPAGFCCPEYVAAIRAEILKRWQSQQGIRGEVVMRFTVERDGRPSGVAIAVASGMAILDLNAQRAIAASRFPALPAEIVQPLVVNMTFAYQRAVNPSGSSLTEALRNLQRYKEQTAGESNPSDQLPPSIVFDAKGVDFGPWLRRFVAEVRRNWFIPVAAMSLRGRVVLKFTIEKSGTIRDVVVHEPSDVQAFNQAAYEAVVRSNPVSPLPLDYPDPHAAFTVTFHYNTTPGAK